VIATAVAGVWIIVPLNNFLQMNHFEKIKLSSNIAAVAGIFCLAVSLLLLLNFWQMSKNDPLESEAMRILIERLSKEPGNLELKQDIRHLDLLARKAYFNSHWQVKTGSYLLLFGAIVFAVALRVYYSLRSAIEIPGQIVENELKARALSQKWLMAGGFAVMLLAFIASFATIDHLKMYSSGETELVEAAPSDPGIEVIEVGAEPSVAETASEPAGATAEEAALPVAEVSPAPAVAAGTPASAAALPDAAGIRANYPSFRGPFGNGVSDHKNIPTDFDGASGRNVLWKIALPLSGYNSPVIWGNRLFVSGANAQKREVYCIDRNSGKIIWAKAADNIPGSPAAPPRTTEDTGLAAPTLYTDGIRVYAIFGTGDIISFDMEGNRVWARNLGVPDNHYGHSSSLIGWKDKLFVQYDTNRGQRLLALNVATGETVWETPRTVKISWASPILANVGGKYQVILATDPFVAGYDADTGKELWTARGLMGEVGPSPAFGEGLVFATQEYATLMAINPANGQIVWQDDEYLSEVSSPVVAKGMVFMATSYGVLVCYDAKTGDKLWEHDDGPGYYSSPVVADNKLFIFDLDGHLQVYALERQKNLLAEASMGTKITSTPAFSDGRMYVRAGTALYCIGK
jgi:outer membrane protein assembly factor BamB